MIFQGKIRPEVRWEMDMRSGGVMHYDDVDTKSGKMVLEVLRDKHPDVSLLDMDELSSFYDLPQIGREDITMESVERVSGNLSGSGGQRGSDAYSVQSWILKFGPVSRKFQEAVYYFVDWMSNEHVPWEATWVLMEGRLIALDKIQGSGRLESVKYGGCFCQSPDEGHMEPRYRVLWNTEIV